jgi:molecular chaperone Hsp33
MARELHMTAEAVCADRIVPIFIEKQKIGGRIVRLENVTTDILGRHDYPVTIANLLGETLALVAMMGSMLKFDGRFVIQTKGDGPVSMLVADYTGDGVMRAYAQFDDERLKSMDGVIDFETLVGKGYIAFSVDQGPDMERYQGIVPLEGQSIRDVALGYFDRSEQIPTHIKLAAGSVHKPGGVTQWRAGGIMIQQTASEGGVDAADVSEDDWTRLGLLLSTASDEELLDTELDEGILAYRLFNEDGVRMMEARPVVFGCSCSLKRVKDMLRSLPQSDQDEMAEDDETEIKCEFCSSVYRVSLPLGLDEDIELNS